MDINNYNYTPTMLDDDNYIFNYKNDDINITIDKERAYSDYIFWLYAFSWDGSLEISGRFTAAAPALSVAVFLKKYHSHIAPLDNNKLSNIIDQYSMSQLNATYSFEEFYNMSATATDTANNDNVTATKDITNKLIYDTYPIIHNNNVVKKGGYYINKGNYDYIIIQNDFSGVYVLYNLNYMHICGTNKDYFETIQDTINYLNAMDQETYFNNLKHLSVEEIHSIYKKYTPCQYHVIRQYIDKRDIKANTRQDARQTETTQDTPHKASKTAVNLFVVTDKPEPVKLPGYELPTLDRIPTYTQRIISRFKPLKSQKVYNNRLTDIKALKNDYMTFNSPVSCHNDKCAGVGAIGGKVAAVNSS